LQKAMFCVLGVAVVVMRQAIVLVVGGNVCLCMVPLYAGVVASSDWFRPIKRTLPANEELDNEPEDE
jgi:hypothetical protein